MTREMVLSFRALLKGGSTSTAESFVPKLTNDEQASPPKNILAPALEPRPRA